MYPVILYSILICTVIITGWVTYIAHEKLKKSIKLLLAFSGAFMLAICFLDLIPQIYNSAFPYIGFMVLLGFFIQLFLEFMSKGIEHGHIHSHGHSAVFPLTVVLSLCIHAFFEGMPLQNELSLLIPGVSSGNHGLLLGICFHKIPVTIALVTLLLTTGVHKLKIIIALVVFALMAPAGAGINYLFGHSISNNFPWIFDAILAVVIGMILHISTTIIFESTEGHRFNLLKLIAIIIGWIIAYFSL